MQCRARAAGDWSTCRRCPHCAKGARQSEQKRNSNGRRRAARGRCTTRPDRRFGLLCTRSCKCRLRACAVRAPIRRQRTAMTQTYREFVVGGVLVAPIVSYGATALLLFLLLRPLL